MTTLYGNVNKDRFVMPSKLTNLIPVNLRFLYDKVFGNNRLHTEKDFRQSELKELRRAYERSKSRQGDKYDTARSIAKDLQALGVGTSLDMQESVPENKILYDDYDMGYFSQGPIDKILKQKTFHPAEMAQNEKHIGNIIMQTLMSPSYRVGNTLGRADYTTDDNGNVIVTDKYQFNPKYYNPTKNNIYDFIRNNIAPTYGEPFDVRVNLGNPKDWNNLWKD